MANQAIAIDPLPGFTGVEVDTGPEAEVEVVVEVGVLALAADDDLREQVGAAAANGSTSREAITRENFMMIRSVFKRWTSTVSECKREL